MNEDDVCNAYFDGELHFYRRVVVATIRVASPMFPITSGDMDFTTTTFYRENTMVR